MRSDLIQNSLLAQSFIQEKKADVHAHLRNLQSGAASSLSQQTPDKMAGDLTTDLLITIPAALGLLWSIKECLYLRRLTMEYAPVSDQDSSKTLSKMKEIALYISDGSVAFLMKEYEYMVYYMIIFSILLGFTVNAPTVVAFIVGCVTSILAGYIGMKIAVYTNIRCTYECWTNIGRGYDVAIKGGSVMGLSLVSLGALALYALIKIMPMAFEFNGSSAMYEAIAGFGLGGSSIALFGRVGGGIYTKAADVGADLSGKNEYGMDEDDPRNPACIADNVGDNVGDVAGMGADLFGSFAEATCAALVVAASASTKLDYRAMMFPLLISTTGIVVGILTLLLVGLLKPVKAISDVETALKYVLIFSTALELPLIWYLAKWSLPATFDIDMMTKSITYIDAAVPTMIGAVSGLIIGLVTEYYTSHSYRPVREVAESQKVAAATGIIYGLALGYLSCIIPTFMLGITILVAHSMCGFYGVALGALGMLSTMTMGLTIDVYGPISDNAGGIAEMSGLGPEVRERTDALDAAGNTTAAIGKGFAIGSAALVSLSLFGAYCVRAGIDSSNVLDPWTFTGLLYGSMMPYAFAAMTMKSVGMAANDMVKECMEQFPKILSGEIQPQYKRCIEISTASSLREMIPPGLLVILSPLVAGVCFGKNCTAGLLTGALVSGVQLAISMSNSGGAWDNAKKYIEAGGLGEGHKKGSATHKNAVTGDTVGDPLKDTSGPALNIVMKLSAIMALVFGSFIAKWSNDKGGPYWIKVDTDGNTIVQFQSM